MRALNMQLRAGPMARPSASLACRAQHFTAKPCSRPRMMVCYAKKKDKTESEPTGEEPPEEEDLISYVTNEATKAAADGTEVAEAAEDMAKAVSDDISSAVEGVADAAAETMSSMTPSPKDVASAAEEMASALVDVDYMSVEDLKAALLDSLYMTERGLAPNAEARAEIHELLNQLEAKCPTPNPTENMDKLAGTWKLIYTSNSPLIAVLALGRLPLVTVGDITQKIDIDALTAESRVELSSPVSKTAITATASFEVRSPKRLQLSLEKGVIQTPELLTDVNIPDSLSLLGVPVDLSNLKGAVEPLNEGIMGLVGQVNNFLSQAPELSVPLTSTGTSTWQLNTYLDEDMRIARGDGGSMFLYVKEEPAVVYPEVSEPTEEPMEA